MSGALRVGLWAVLIVSAVGFAAALIREWRRSPDSPPTSDWLDWWATYGFILGLAAAIALVSDWISS